MSNAKTYENPYPHIAVVGSGYWGKNLVRNFHQLGALKLICDKNDQVLSHFKEKYPQVETCFAFHDILNRKDITGVVIATAAETHYTLTREALLAGKHVYVEKHMALLEEEGAEELAERAKYEQYKMTAPQVWNVYIEGNAEIQMEVGFEEFLIQIGEHTKKDVNNLNVFEFYTLVKYLKSKNGNN